MNRFDNVSPYDSSVKTLELALKKFSSEFLIDNRRLQGISADNLLLSVNRHMQGEIVRFDHFVYCTQPKRQCHTVSYPKTWVDAFKEVHPKLCRWLKPPQYTSVHVQWQGMVAFTELRGQREYKTVQIWKPDYELLAE